MICAVHRDEVEFWWPLVEDFYERLLEQTTEYSDIEAIKDRISEGEYIMMLVINNNIIEMVLSCEVLLSDTGHSVLTLPHICGSNMSDWLSDLAEILAEVAQELGCTRVQTSGSRPAWAKILKQYGGKYTQTTMKFDIPEHIIRRHNIER